MVPSDEARNTREYSSFYIIQPAHHNWRAENANEYDGEMGNAVDEDFAYTSDNNSEWYSTDQLREVID
jgi:UDP-N-acetylglucosamine 4,6-dehydratase